MINLFLCIFMLLLIKHLHYYYCITTIIAFYYFCFLNNEFYCLFIHWVLILCYHFIIDLLLVFQTNSNCSFFHWSLSDSKYPQVFWTLLSILAYLNRALTLVVLILPLISNSPSHFFQVIWDHSKDTNDNWYHCHLYVPWLLQFSCKIHVFVDLCRKN